jgi:hypothetical protein
MSTFCVFREEECYSKQAVRGLHGSDPVRRVALNKINPDLLF